MFEFYNLCIQTILSAIRFKFKNVVMSYYEYWNIIP